MENELLSNIEKIHTTEMGEERIKRNLCINVDNTVQFCKNIITMQDSIIERKGKNWYIYHNEVIITVNAYSYTIITAHKKKS